MKRKGKGGTRPPAYSKINDVYRWFAGRSDGFWLFWLAILTIVSRWIGHMQHLYLADSVRYALALDQYDMTVHQPHPPGYGLYVAVAKLIYFFTRDANLALVIVSIILSVGALYAVFYLAKNIYGRRVAWLAAIIFITGPVVWLYGQVALNYMADACFGALFAFFSYRAISKAPSVRDVLLSSLILGVGGGFRPTLMLFMAPLWLWMVYRQKNFRWRSFWQGGSIVLAVTLLWLLPAVYLSGGWLSFWKMFYSLTMAPNGSLLTLAAVVQGGQKVWEYFSFIFNGLVLNFNLAAILVALFLLLLATPSLTSLRFSFINIVFWMLWLVPALLFYLLVIYALPGYSLILLPALSILAAVAIERLVITINDLGKNWYARSSHWTANSLVIITILIAAANIYGYWRPSPHRLTDVGMTPAHFSIAKLDRVWKVVIPAIREEFHPQNSIIGVEQSYQVWSLSHFQYYLPQYRTYQQVTWGMYNPNERSWYLAEGRHLKLVDDLEVWPSDTNLLVIRNDWSGVAVSPLKVKEFKGATGGIAYYDLTDPATRDVVRKIEHLKFVNEENITP